MGRVYFSPHYSLLNRFISLRYCFVLLRRIIERIRLVHILKFVHNAII